MLIIYGMIFCALLVGSISILVLLVKGDGIDEDVISSDNDNNDYMKRI